MKSQVGKKVLITGGAGLIGSFLTEELVHAGYEVTVVDDLSKGRRLNLRSVLNLIDFREADLEVEAMARDAVSGEWDCVYHLASRAYGIGYSEGNHIEVLLHNERITNNIISGLRDFPPGIMVIASSSCVHRDDGPKITPELYLFDGSPENANFGYGWSKRFLEQKFLLFCNTNKIPLLTLRPFNIYGERYNWQGPNSQAIPTLVKRVMDREDPVIIWGTGQQRRNYMHAQDCARLMKLLSEVYRSTLTVNIGSESTISIQDLVMLIQDIANIKGEISLDTSKPQGRLIKSSDSTFLRTLLPGVPLHSIFLREGLTRMLSWYQSEFASPLA